MLNGKPRRSKMKKPIGRPSKYPYEFRKMVAEKALTGTQTYRALAREYKIPSAVITRWKRHYAAGTLDEMSEPRRSMDSGDLKAMNLEKEIRMLKEQLGDLYMQNHLLKKAQAWAQQMKNESSLIITSENLDQSDEGVQC
jgi:transposase-like protein